MTRTLGFLEVKSIVRGFTKFLSSLSVCLVAIVKPLSLVFFGCHSRTIYSHFSRIFYNVMSFIVLRKNDFYNFIEKITFVCNTDNQQVDIIALKTKEFYFLIGCRNKIRWSCINLLHSGNYTGIHIRQTKHKT